MATVKEQQAVGPTRLPWAIYDFEGEAKGYPKTIIVAPTGESICEIAGGWPQCTLAENEANTALIVRAVNNHDALIEALKSAHTWLAGLALMHSFNGQTELIAQINAALTAAQE